MDESIPVSRLKGLKVLFENDLYELALFKLKVNLTQDTPTQTVRTTVHGIISAYEYLGKINHRRACNMAARHGLPLDVPIVPDEKQP